MVQLTKLHLVMKPQFLSSQKSDVSFLLTSLPSRLLTLGIVVPVRVLQIDPTYLFINYLHLTRILETILLCTNYLYWIGILETI